MTPSSPRPENLRIGDRVSWMGGAPGSFGSLMVRWTGIVVSTGCGVPYYFDPPQYTIEGYSREAGRHPAVRVDPDYPQHGVTERDPIAPPCIVPIKDLIP